jgi:hypothetical protein
MKRAAATLAVVGCGVFGVASAASADTIGQTFTDIYFCQAGGGQFQTNYTAPSAGLITSFAFRTSADNAGNQLDFWVLRPGSNPGQYTIIGHSGVETLAGDGTDETFTPAKPIRVQAGDILGLYEVTDVQHCGKASSNDEYYAYFGSEPSVGYTFTTASAPAHNDLNESAQFTAGTPIDSTSADPVSGPVLDDGTSYTVTVTGTYTAYSASLMSGGVRGWVVCGEPEPEPMFGTGSAVGQDAQFVFARPQRKSCDPRYGFPHKYGAAAPALKFDTGDGSGFHALTPDSNAYNPQHAYTYTVTGHGAPLQTELIDSNYADNHGTLVVSVAPASPPAS